MNRGWFNDPYKHALASRGVYTTSRARPKTLKHLGRTEVPPKELYDINWERISGYEGTEEKTKEEMKKVIKLFWWCSYYDSLEYFPFDEFIESTESLIRNHNLDRIINYYILENIQEGAYISWDIRENNEKKSQRNYGRTDGEVYRRRR